MEIKKDILINALHMLKDKNIKVSKVIYDDLVYSIVKLKGNEYCYLRRGYNMDEEVTRKAVNKGLLNILYDEVYIIYDEDYVIPEEEIERSDLWGE